MIDRSRAGALCLLTESIILSAATNETILCNYKTHKQICNLFKKSRKIKSRHAKCQHAAGMINIDHVLAAMQPAAAIGVHSATTTTVCKRDCRRPAELTAGQSSSRTWCCIDAETISWLIIAQILCQRSMV
jgi:hypothetical protein